MRRRRSAIRIMEMDTFDDGRIETAGPRYGAPFHGVVVDNQDPLGIGRVRVQVPGLLDPESAWAFPVGAMLGISSGFWAVPELESNVVVWLVQGDVNHPVYVPGPFGKPEGDHDRPGQVAGTGTDHLVVRWRNFHLTMDGTPGAEKLTVEDLTSGTKLEIDRQTGDLETDVEGDQATTVAGDRAVTVEQGDETRTVVQGDLSEIVAAGSRSAEVQGDDSIEVAAGSMTRTVASGDDVKTIATGNSTETIAAGQKAITAGTSITLTAGLALTLIGAQVTVLSNGISNQTSIGLLTRQFLGGINDTISATWTAQVNSLVWTIASLFQILATTIHLGTGPYRRLLNENFANTTFPSHTHMDSVGGMTTGVIAPASVPTTDLTTHTTAS